MSNLHFNVLIYNRNIKEFEPYDVIPYLVSEFKGLRKKDRPKTEKEFQEFVDNKLRYMYWSRCEYEVILKEWPSRSMKEQINMCQQCRSTGILSDKTSEEYENICQHCRMNPDNVIERKIDIYQQCCMNMDIIVAILCCVLEEEFKIKIEDE